MKTHIQEVYQCEHCNQHYLRRKSWEKHLTSCKKREDESKNCFQCAFMQIETVRRCDGSNLVGKVEYYCDRMGISLHRFGRKSSIPDGEIIMPNKCPVFSDQNDLRPN